MSDKDDNKESGSRKRRFRVFRMPGIQRSPLRVNEEFNRLRSAISNARRTCPHDGSLLSVEDIYTDLDVDYVQTEDGRTLPAEEVKPEKALVCPQCGFAVTISTMVREAQADAAPIKRASDQLAIMAFAVSIGFIALGFLTGNLFTLIGGFIFGLTLFVRALALRYRHWQAVNNRLFETRPPLAEWIRSELRS